MNTISGPQPGKALVICEKPSVATDLLSAFGGGTRGNGFFEFSLGKITWCFGHLVELVPPGMYNPDWEKWEMEYLPMVPEGFRFKYGVSAGKDGGKGAANQLKVIGNLLKECDYLVSATDAGREGELIFWETAKFVGWGRGRPAAVLGEKPCYRFWCNKMTADGLRSSWQAMRPAEEFLPLTRAAYCRSEADWLLGINLTRAATKAFPQKWGEGAEDKVKVWSVGRVQTPVLALIVRRDLAIENFVSKPFYEVRLDYRDSSNSTSDSFSATLQVPEGISVFEREAEGDSQGQRQSKTAFANKADAQRVLDEILARQSEYWKVEDQVTEGVENPPGLFSLTDLQRWCNQAWGWSAQKTLAAAQSAYEEEKVLTYPRTTSAFLPEDSKSEMDRVHGIILSQWAGRALPALNSSVLPAPSESSRAGFLFDDSKISDHFAIVPTGVLPKDTGSDVGKLWLAVVRRFLTAFASPAQVRSVKRFLSLAGFPEGERKAFVSGKTYLNRGWMEVDDILSELTGGVRKSSTKVLPLCGDSAVVLSGLLHEGATTPPRAYDEASLLAVMENISTKLSGEELEDGEVSLGELKDVLSGLGLGTPATRADIIETLLLRGFITRSSNTPTPKISKAKVGKTKASAKYLCSTPSGRFLISSLERIDLKYLTEPLLTAQWEKRLSDMAEGNSEETREEFLSDLVDSLKNSVSIFAANITTGQLRSQPKDTDFMCPKSGAPVQDMGNFYIFPGAKNLRLWKEIAQRKMTPEDYSLLITEGKSALLDGFVSKKGKKFAAHLIMGAENKIEFEFPEREALQGVVLEKVCPKSGKPVLDMGKFYRFPGLPEVAFWKTIAQRDVTTEEYSELIASGKVGPLGGFISSKGSKFSAMLVLKDGKVGFDFQGPTGGPKRKKKA